MRKRRRSIIWRRTRTTSDGITVDVVAVGGDVAGDFTFSVGLSHWFLQEMRKTNEEDNC